MSNKGLDANVENKGTGVYVYAKRVKEITPNISLEEISKQYEQKKATFETETLKLGTDSSDSSDKVLNSKLFVLKEEVEFLKKVVSIVKEMKS